MTEFGDDGFVPGSHGNGFRFGKQLFSVIHFPDDPFSHHVCTKLLSCVHVSPERCVVPCFLWHFVEEHLVDAFRYLCMCCVVS